MRITLAIIGLLIFEWIGVVCGRIYLYWLKYCTRQELQRHIRRTHAYNGLSYGDIHNRVVLYSRKAHFISRISLFVFFVLSIILVMPFISSVAVHHRNLQPPHKSLFLFLFLLMWGAHFCIAWPRSYYKLLHVRIEGEIIGEDDKPPGSP